MSIFDQEVTRRGTNSYKWQVAEDELPMWVADMDFPAAPVVQEALRERINEAVFGYEVVPQAFFKSFKNWWGRRHHLPLSEEWMMFCTGVVPAISSIVRKLTADGDNVVVLSPVYNIFYNSIVNNRRNILASNLLYHEGDYTINFADLEEKLARPETSLLIFCNPHNPIGKIWDLPTLKRVGDLCVKHDVVILSDEIHCDLTFPGKQYIPFLSVSEEIAQQVVMCVSPSKAFNLAGLQTSAIIIKNPELKRLVERGINTDEVAEPNSFATIGAVTALTEGESWLEELRLYLYENYQLIEKFLAQQLPEVQLISSNATYLAWIDCRKVTSDAHDLVQFIREKTGLVLSSGEIFGETGQAFIRLNYATSRRRLMDGLERLKEGIKQYG